ncbi:hypothetical protein CEXT_387401 [Caerostris extrusa]|uniref:Uncharacterized protein n=1 Tax=Caerostris extrusa TaxID=172846 RepID=A0AAV4P1I4_CAEEX|nr:hypothetical protein CEXT_387401 [Caerostris extrusa]
MFSINFSKLTGDGCCKNIIFFRWKMEWECLPKSFHKESQSEIILQQEEEEDRLKKCSMECGKNASKLMSGGKLWKQNFELSKHLQEEREMAVKKKALTLSMQVLNLLEIQFKC